MILFLVTGTIVALASHRWVRPFLLALLISGPVAAFLFQGVVTIELGHLDPFAPIALFTTTLAGWVIALLVGVAMRWLRFDSGTRAEAGGATEPQQQGLPSSKRPGEGAL